MKLLIVIDTLGSGGAEASTEVICDFLKQKNISFEIVCLGTHEVGILDRMIAKGHKISFVKKGSFFSEMYQISRLIKKGKFDIVHSVLFKSNMRTRFAKLFANFIHIESLVNTTYSEERFKDEKVNQKALKLYFWIDRLTASYLVNHFHSITQTVKNHYCQKLRINPDKVTVIFRGRKALITEKKYIPLTSGRSLKLINIGRQDFQKGQIHLLRAIKVLVDKGYKIQLEILGRAGGESKTLNDYIAANNLQDYVFLKGFDNNVATYLLNADLFVFPSMYEGLGGALIEAQSAGLPIVCNDIPVFNEILLENKNALLIDVYDTFKFAEAIETFIMKPDKISQFGENSLKNYYDKFNLDSNNEKMYQLFKSFI